MREYKIDQVLVYKIIYMPLLVKQRQCLQADVQDLHRGDQSDFNSKVVPYFWNNTPPADQCVTFDC